MYNYSKYKNLTEFYRYLKANNLYDQVIEQLTDKDETNKNTPKISEKNNKNNIKQEKDN